MAKKSRKDMKAPSVKSNFLRLNILYGLKRGGHFIIGGAPFPRLALVYYLLPLYRTLSEQSLGRKSLLGNSGWPRAATSRNTLLGRGTH